MKKELGTPNQKAVYSRCGIALEKAMETLMDDTLPIEEKESVYKGVDTVSKIANSMCKAIVTEAVLAKTQIEIEQHAAVVRNSKANIRNIELKKFDEITG